MSPRSAAWLLPVFLLSGQVRALDTDTIDGYLTAQMAELGIPGAAVAIVHEGRTVHVRGYGATGSGAAVGPDTLFELASVTKPFTALAVMQLVEAGEVDLDASLRRYLPELELEQSDAASNIAVRHLLAHTSGFSTAAGRRHFFTVNNDADALRVYLRDFRDEPLTAAPGEQFQYSNVNYQLLALLVETVSGRPFERYVEEQVLRPLDMTYSTWLREEALRLGGATGHRLWWGFPVAGGDLPESRYEKGSGGLFSSAADLSHLLLAYLEQGQYRGRTILSPQARDWQWEVQIDDLGEGGPGLGWFVRETSVGRVVEHAGDVANFHADLLLLPERRLGVVVLMNVNGATSGPQLSALSTNLLTLAAGGAAQPLPENAFIDSMLLISLVMVPVLAAIAVLSLRRVWRWWREPQTRPRRWWREWLRAAGFVTFNLAVAAVLLVGVPVLFQASLAVVFWFSPDYAWPAAVCGVLAVVASAARLITTGRGQRAFSAAS